MEGFGKKFFILVLFILVLFMFVSLKIEYDVRNKVLFQNKTTYKLTPKTIKVVEDLIFQVPHKDGMSKGVYLQGKDYDLYVFKTSYDGVYVFLKISKVGVFSRCVLGSFGAIEQDISEFNATYSKFEDMEFPKISDGVTYNVFNSNVDTIKIIRDSFFRVLKDNQNISVTTDYERAESCKGPDFNGVIIVWDNKNSEILFLGNFNAL